MPRRVTVRDETTSGKTTREWSLDLLTEEVTLREVIRSRVYQEVSEHNAAKRAVFCGLIQPEGAIATPEGYKLPGFRAIDWRRQYERACAAFEAGRIVVIVGPRQAEALDEAVVLEPETVFTFLRLVPLAGG